MREDLRHTWRQSIRLGLTQVSFSLTSIFASLAIPFASDDPAADLALLSAVLLFQGFARVTIGYNLSSESSKNSGTVFVVFILAASIGAAFFRNSILTWIPVALLSGLYEILRTFLLKSDVRRKVELTISADLAWGLPFLLSALAGPLVTYRSVLLGSGLAISVLLVSRACRGELCAGLKPSVGFLTWQSEGVLRSVVEAWSGIVVPLGIVLVFNSSNRLADLGAMRVVGNLFSPIGSFVGVLVLVWPSIRAKSRQRLLLPIGLIPVIGVAPVLLFPSGFEFLAAGSESVLPYAFAWVGFGCAQTLLALVTAELRISRRDPIRPPWGLFAIWGCSLLVAIGHASDLASRLAIALLAGSPLLGLARAYRERKRLPSHRTEV